MRIYEKLSSGELEQLFRRPCKEDNEIKERVRGILSLVREGGDKATFVLVKEIDKYEIDSASVLVSPTEYAKANTLLSDEFKQAIAQAMTNIETFHKAQLRDDISVTTMPGVELSQRRVPISRVGIYIPGGTAPLFSTLLMCALPARIAGCKEVIVCTPADSNGQIAPEILYCASICGIDRIYKLGGAVAIAAMAYGTESIARVNKIFGPGNRYVTYAKQLVAIDSVAIDMPAGPSEVMVLADESARADFVAADLLSQLEHGGDSQAIAVVSTKEFAEAVVVELEKQRSGLDRQAILDEAINNCHIIVESNVDTMLKMANKYAAEHLIISLQNASELASKVENAGSVFVGNYSPESVGDYASGTNHTLPTSGWATSFSGVNVDSFSKYITCQTLSREGLKNISSTVMKMAEHEGLAAHKNAVCIRLNEDLL